MDRIAVIVQRVNHLRCELAVSLQASEESIARSAPPALYLMESTSVISRRLGDRLQARGLSVVMRHPEAPSPTDTTYLRLFHAAMIGAADATWFLELDPKVNSARMLRGLAQDLGREFTCVPLWKRAGGRSREDDPDE